MRNALSFFLTPASPQPCSHQTMLTDGTMVTGDGNDVFGDDIWGADDLQTRSRTDASEGSDFTPAQLKMMKTQTLDQAAPLPKGVRDVQWQPPTATGLAHSAPIFQTEADAAGGLRMTSVGLSGSNCHFRSWQEDNGVARTFASETVIKEVDGEERIVSIGSTKAAAASCSFISPRNTSVAPDPLVLEHLREVKRLSLRSNDSTDSSKLSKDGDSPVRECATSAPSSPRQPSPALRRPSTGAGSDSTQEIGCSLPFARAEGNDESPTGNIDIASASLSTIDARDLATSPTPRRPSGSPSSSCTRKPRPGRSLSPKVWEDGNGRKRVPVAFLAGL